MADLVPRIVNFTIKNAKGNPCVDMDVVFKPRLAPGDNFIAGENAVYGKTGSDGSGSVTLYTYENSFLNYFVEWDGSGGRREFTLADEPGDAELGQLLTQSLQSEDLRFTPATVDSLGAVKPDGVTITIAADGTISAAGGGGSGDMLAATYDPQNIADDAFDRANHTGTQAQSTITNLVTDLAAKAPLASPTFTGTPTAPTAAPGTNTTQIATTAFVRAAVAALVDSAPEALDTLNELAAALGDDPNFAATIMAALANKQPIDADLTTIAGLSPSNDDILQRKSGAWTARTPAQLKTDLALSKSDVGLGNVPNTDATNRANHTGTQTAATISDFASAVNALIGAANIDAAKITGTKTSSFISDFATAVLAALPAQTGNSGKFLTTDGSALSWGTPPGGLAYTSGGTNLFIPYFDGTGFLDSPLKVKSSSEVSLENTSGFFKIGDTSGNNWIGIERNVSAMRFWSREAATNAIAAIQSHGLLLSSGRQLILTNSTTPNTNINNDVGLERSGNNILKITNGSTGPGGLMLGEMTAPSTPSANNVILYAEDDGSGKTRLMALFPTGAAQQVAIEP